MENKRAQLIFIPSAGAGHLASSVEAAKLLLAGNDHLSISFIILKLSSDHKLAKYTETLATSDRFRLFYITIETDSLAFFKFIDAQIPRIKELISDKISPAGPPLAGFVLDMFCSSMIEFSDEFNVPCYFFFTSSAAFLGYMLHMQFLADEHHLDPTQLKGSNAVLDFPTMEKPLPARVMPVIVFHKESLPFLLSNGRRFRKSRGILVNSFTELEPHAIKILSKAGNPPIYPIGPVLNLGSDKRNGKKSEIIKWLDDQPKSSVVFLCFGSLGCFGVDQVKEIAAALENSNHRFLWSLRRPPQDKEKMEYPADYEDPEEVVPAGFIDRTSGIGKVIGWAPQTEILGHAAIGGFVSHCGWNSILESLWYGVPIATWPMYAEQQFNAFEVVEELGLGVEIEMDFGKDSEVVVRAEEIERGIRCVMEHDSEVRRRVKEVSERSGRDLMEGGSSVSYLNRFIRDVMDNVR